MRFKSRSTLDSPMFPRIAVKFQSVLFLLLISQDKPTDHLDYLAARDVERSVVLEQKGNTNNSVMIDTMTIPPKSTLPVGEPSERSIQPSSLPTEVQSRLSHIDRSDNLAGEASIEPVDVSIVTTSRNDKSFIEDISMIQADPVNEATILDENEPDDLFVGDRSNKESGPLVHHIIDDNSWEDNSFDELVGKKHS